MAAPHTYGGSVATWVTIAEHRWWDPLVETIQRPHLRELLRRLLDPAGETGRRYHEAPEAKYYTTRPLNRGAKAPAPEEEEEAGRNYVEPGEPVAAR